MRLFRAFVGIFPFLQLDETLAERLWGLTEMFPETVRTAAEVSAQCSVSLLKKFYRFGRFREN